MQKNSKKSQQPKRYTAEEENIIIEKVNEGMQYAEIAKLINRKTESVRTKIRDLQKVGRIEKKRHFAQKLPTAILDQVKLDHPDVDEATLQYFSEMSKQHIKYEKYIENRSAFFSLLVDIYAAKPTCHYFSFPLNVNEEFYQPVIVEAQGELVLVCKAAKKFRGGLSHNTFIAMCKTVAQNWQ